MNAYRGDSFRLFECNGRRSIEATSQTRYHRYNDIYVRTWNHDPVPLRRKVCGTRMDSRRILLGIFQRRFSIRPNLGKEGLFSRELLATRFFVIPCLTVFFLFSFFFIIGKLSRNTYKYSNRDRQIQRVFLRRKFNFLRFESHSTFHPRSIDICYCKITRDDRNNIHIIIW